MVPTSEPVVEELDFNVVFSDVVAQFPKDKGYGTVAVDALNTELVENPGLFLLDVREPAELEADGYIQGAVSIPVRTLLDDLDKLPGLDEPIVINCKSGHRGVLAMNVLSALGYTNLRNLAGGLNAWVKAEITSRQRRSRSTGSNQHPHYRKCNAFHSFTRLYGQFAGRLLQFCRNSRKRNDY